MDGDDFSRVTRLGRAAADAVMHAATKNAAFDGSAFALLIDRFVDGSKGISSLPDVLAVLYDLAAQPLLLSTRIDEALSRVNTAVHGPECGMLDIQLGRITESAVLRGEFAPRTILECFVHDFIERNVIMARQGLVETHGLQYAQTARDLAAPIVRAAAAELLRRPDAKHLGLFKAFRIDETSNLLEVA